MKTASQIRLQHPAFLDLDALSRHENRLSRACELGRDLLVEVYETLAGMFAIPFHTSHYDPILERLNDDLLRDIGRERISAPRLDI